MLDHLKKFFKPEEEKVEMATETTQAEMSVELTAELTELKASFAQVSETLAATKEQLEQATAALAALTAEKQAIEAAAKQEKMDARMSKIVETVGEGAQATNLMAATKEMGDEGFDAVLAVVAASRDEESKSALFTEAGVDAQPKPVVEKDTVTRLADNIATQFNLKKEGK